MRLVLLGAPGAGKGTQGARLAQHFGIPRIATGDMFREALASDSLLGKQARVYVERGELVPDEITIGIVQERLSQPDCGDGFVLDGFPRTQAQAVALDKTLAQMGKPLHAAVYLEVPVDVAVQRLIQRLVCSSCGQAFPEGDPRVEGGRCPACGGALEKRVDDNEETARRRLAVYEESTRPVIDYYRERALLLTVDGRHSVDQVFDAILRGLALIAPSEAPSRVRRAGADGA